MAGAVLQLAHLCTGKDTVDSQERGAESSLALGYFKAVLKAAQICCLSLWRASLTRRASDLHTQSMVREPYVGTSTLTLVARVGTRG